MADELKPLRVLCDCGEVLESFYSYYLDALDISYWSCESCGQTFSIEVDIQKHEQTSPAEKKEPKNKSIRMRCQNCTGVLYSPRTYINLLPKQVKWRCQSCWTVYEIKVKVTRGARNEVSW